MEGTIMKVAEELGKEAVMQISQDPKKLVAAGVVASNAAITGVATVALGGGALAPIATGTLVAASHVGGVAAGIATTLGATSATVATTGFITAGIATVGIVAAPLALIGGLGYFVFKKKKK